MKGEHLEIMVEEPSMESFLRIVLPTFLPNGTTFDIYPFQGKDDLLGKLPSRLQGYKKWLPPSYRIVIVVDRDDDPCIDLKKCLENITRDANLASRSAVQMTTWEVVNRIAIEELEAWYFGDWEAVRECYPRVSKAIPSKSGFRDPDAIVGGTWEAFERILQQGGYFKAGLRKIEAARSVGSRFVATRCTSASFRAFRDVLMEATQ